MLVIIDYGMGNLGSVLKSFKKIKVDAIIGSSKGDIEKASKLVLPGVGHFSNAMKRLREFDYLNILNKKVLEDKTPILGICLGMQLFAKYSFEGKVEGLGWIDSNVVRFDVGDKIKWKIPHMGWNSIKHKKESSILSNIKEDESFYFVHSYHMVCNNQKDILTTTDYFYNFVSSVQKNNIYGVQFHPEKSHDQGIQMIKNFASI